MEDSRENMSSTLRLFLRIRLYVVQAPFRTANVRLELVLLLSQPLGRKLAQLVVDQWQELVGGVRIASLGGGQNTRDVGHARQSTARGATRLVPPARALRALVTRNHFPSPSVIWTEDYLVRC